LKIVSLVTTVTIEMLLTAMAILKTGGQTSRLALLQNFATVCDTFLQ